MVVVVAVVVVVVVVVYVAVPESFTKILPDSYNILGYTLTLRFFFSFLFLFCHV